MGNISFLTPNSWKYAGGQASGTYADTDNGYGIVQIVPKGESTSNSYQPITGVMKEPLSLSFDSEWVSMDSVDIPFMSDLINEAGKVIGSGTMLAGSGDWGYVWKSKKIWKQSGYVKVGGTFVVVDWNGDGEPLRAAHNMIQYCTPGGNSESQVAVDNAATQLVGAKDVAKGLAVSATNFVGLNGESTGRIIDKAYMNTFQDASDLFALKECPPIIALTIGKYFYHDDMVILNVSTKFSKEVSSQGPLSVEISFEAESRTRTKGIGDIGLLSQAVGRVSTGKVE
jgi:hypothetical protein